MSDTSDLIWICDTCGKPVRDGCGYVHVSNTDCAEFRRNLTAWGPERTAAGGGPQGLRSGGDIWDYPDDSDYWFAVARCRTPAAMLRWTAHLLGKGWLAEETDWDEFVFSALRRSRISTAC